jgi:hypothetical protein
MEFNGNNSQGIAESMKSLNVEIQSDKAIMKG